MRLHRFYITEKVGSQKELVIKSVELVNQITRVFRLGVGDKVIIFDGSGYDFECKLLEVKPQGGELMRFAVGEVRSSRYMPARKVVLYQSIIKKDKFEWVVEKATELGVTDIVPVLAERSLKKSLDQRRLQKIAIEASEQCGRGDVPVVHSARLNLTEISDTSFQKVALNLEGEDFTSLRFPSTALGVNNLKESLALFIGPEGGWSGEELEMFHKQKVSICSLGKQVLRAETATIVALSKLLI